jgi:hypothetical protein
MGRSELALARLVEIAEAFCTRHPSPRGRGRPPTYSEGLVLALWALGQLHGLSWRKLESISRQLLPRVPDFSTLHYRVRRLPQERWEEFNRWLAQRALAGDEPELLLVDGTGWGFGLPYWACWRRGEELRRLRSHVKGVVVVGVAGGKRVLLGASLGPPYSDERRLAERWLQSQGSKGWGEGLWFVADALYGMGREVLSQVRRLGWRAVVAVREGVWRGVKSEERQWAQRLWQEHRDIYRRRYLVESWIGSIKGLCGSYCRERSLEMALRAVWGRLLLWNLGLVLLALHLLTTHSTS